ncbi:hypothetical protein [Scytonema sp. NUACC21]
MSLPPHQSLYVKYCNNLLSQKSAIENGRSLANHEIQVTGHRFIGYCYL